MAKRGRPRGSKNGAGVSRPSAFAVKFEGGVWFVRQGTSWRRAEQISIIAHVITLPSGVLVGEGVVTRTGPQAFAVTP